MQEIFREVEATGEELIVTEHGKPVLRIVPIQAKVSASQLFAGLQGQVLYHEDIDAPTIVGWNEI
jgi:antitoxin (DNA-binding transcriptional repressor) of toxin-antitoxin stability system